MQTRTKPFLTILLSVLLLDPSSFAQDARESLGPKESQANTKGPHPLTELMGKADFQPAS